ncbi:retron St85 family RNA-directed DNA polymerase [Cytobacillus sp. FJAT-54145]|uniref:RNA-directed DNA polymerase n=1 Tax=Cytobacillus spartinae TaxID=3299023 RepID=A0ABW6KBF0_9BACI
MTYIINLKEELAKSDYDVEYQELCLNYANFLISNGLPVIFDKKHLSLLMGINFSSLNYYVINTDHFYQEYKIPKKNGEFRLVLAPSFNLKSIQKWILENILYNYQVSENATGFVKGKSILDNALPHVAKDVVFNLDIKDFFPSVTFKQVFYIFYNKGYTKEISFTLTKLLTYKETLPQGSPASPYIANIICKRMDQFLENLAKTHNANYTRYADDITFSGDTNIENIINPIRSIINNEGFTINEKKVRIQNRNSMQEVTGLTVNNAVKVKRKYKKKLEQHIYYCQKHGVFSHLKYTGLENKSYFKEYLYGMANFIKMIEPDVGNRYIDSLNEIIWN